MSKHHPIFDPQFYRFSTHDPGRPTTLYFSDFAGNTARIRRGHPQGASVIFQGMTKRLFMSPNAKVNHFRALQDQDLARGDMLFPLIEDLYNRIYTRTAAPPDLAAYSMLVRPGWHVLDFVPGVTGHVSQGTVILNDIPPTRAEIADYEKTYRFTSWSR
jgi:hypothetical protein